MDLVLKGVRERERDVRWRRKETYGGERECPTSIVVV
jgi:hypothetical protein